MAAPAPRCRTHHQPAGWKCVACKALLCPDCAAIQKTMHVEMIVCTLCRQLANPLTRSREDEAPYLQRLPGAFAWPLGAEGAMSFASLALFVGVLSWFGGMGRTVASLGLYAASYAIIRMTATNQSEFFVESNTMFELVWPVAKSSAIYLTLGMVGLIYALWLKPPAHFAVNYFVDPVFAVLGVTAFVLGPMTTLMAACHAPLSQMLNPALVFAYIGKIGSDYWVALLVLFGLGIFGGAAGFVIRLLNILPVSLVPTILASTAEVYFSFVSARMLGLLLFVHGDRVDYGIPSDYVTPLLGLTQPRAVFADAQPRAVDTSMPEHEPAAVPRSHAPIEFDEGAPAVPMTLEPRAQQPAAPTELDASALPSASDYFAKSVRESAARGDWSTALDAWKASPDKAALGLDAEHLTGLGRTAAAQGEDAVAREVLELAAQGGGSPLACARAKVILGRLLHERFSDTAAAHALYHEVLTQAPGSDAARFAQKMLEPAVG